MPMEKSSANPRRVYALLFVFSFQSCGILLTRSVIDMDYRTDLAMERTIYPGGMGEGVSIQTQQDGKAVITWVRIHTKSAATRLGKAEGTYWTMMHPELPELNTEDRIEIARQVAQTLRIMLPPHGDILVLGLGNRRMTADALGDRVVSGILVTRHLKEDSNESLRGVCALSPGVMGVTGVETAEFALGLVEHLKPSAVLVVDALAAMECDHIGTTIQLTDTGIHPGSGVGNHRKGITEEVLHVPVIAMGIPMVVYASTIVRDALKSILSAEKDDEEAHALAEQLVQQAQYDLVVTPRNIDELLSGLSDMLALAINAALQPEYSIDELAHLLH